MSFLLDNRSGVLRRPGRERTRYKEVPGAPARKHHAQAAFRTIANFGWEKEPIHVGKVTVYLPLRRFQVFPDTLVILEVA